MIEIAEWCSRIATSQPRAVALVDLFSVFGEGIVLLLLLLLSVLVVLLVLGVLLSVLLQQLLLLMSFVRQQDKYPLGS